MVSTSVNVSGKPFAHSLNDIDPEIIDKVDAIYNPDFIIKSTTASQIIKLNTDGNITIIRK